MNSASPPPLASLEKRWRVLYLTLFPAALCGLTFIRPGSFPVWFLFPVSCGAITGLPCIFCGLTRAMYHLLHGELLVALYYNWLALPLVTGALALGVTNALELWFDRNFLACRPRPRLTRVSLGALAAGFLLLWSLQVYLAVSQHKAELLNPNGPLYSLVVR